MGAERELYLEEGDYWVILRTTEVGSSYPSTPGSGIGLARSWDS